MQNVEPTSKHESYDRNESSSDEDMDLTEEERSELMTWALNLNSKWNEPITQWKRVTFYNKLIAIFYT